MTTRPARPLALVALFALLFTGCTIVDARDEIRIEPEGTLYAEWNVSLTVKGPFDRFRVAVDGDMVKGTFPTGERVVVPVSEVANPGRHTLEVLAIDTALPLRATRTLVIDPAPLEVVSVTPTEREITSGEPLVIEATFTSPIAPPPATGVEVTRGLDLVPASASLLSDGRTLRIAVQAPLDQLGSVRVSVAARDLRGGSGKFELGTWSAPALTLAFDAPLADLATNGTVGIAVHGDGTALPEPLEVYAGSLRVATLDAPPWQLSWDTRGVAEGSYPLSLRVRGRYVPGPFPTVNVDRTVPSATCAPAESAPDDLWVGECVRVVLSEPLPGGAPSLRVNGAPRLVKVTYLEPAEIARRLDLCPTDAPPSVPSVVTIGLPPDPAGNAAVDPACTLGLPAWRAPWGKGPVVIAGSTLRTTQVAFDVSTPGTGGWSMMKGRLLWTTADDRISGALSGSTGWPTSSGISRLDRTGPVSELTFAGLSAAWTDAAGAYSAAFDDGGDIGLSIGPAGSRGPALSRDGTLLALSVPSGSGGRRLETRVTSYPGGGTWTSAGHPDTDPAAVADSPAMSWNAPSAPLLAWIQTPAGGGTAELRAALGDLAASTWSPLGASLSADLAPPASEPAAYAVGEERAVAWVEGGRVLARRWNGAAFGAPDVLTAPGATGRTPRFVADVSGRPVIVFVETDTAGDHIRARRFDGAGWEPLPDPFGDAPGVVEQVVANERGGVAWLDGAGEVRLRVYNR